MTEIKGRLLLNESLDKYTSWKVGGPAKQMYLPADREDLLVFLQQLPDDEIVYWMGMGSNLLIRDGGIAGTVVNTRGRLKKLSVNQEGEIYAEAGVPCALVARFCSENGYTGAEFLAGIPGTMGGALKMNAGAFGGETWDIVKNVETVNASGRVMFRQRKEFNVSYRSVTGPEDEWFLAACLQLKKSNEGIGLETIRDLLARRAQTQPTRQLTCGSVFKNPESDYAARLIEACGLKSYSIGGACVSEKHANFIVNTGKATASDIEALIEFIRNEVYRLHGIKLQMEVCVVGEKVRS